MRYAIYVLMLLFLCVGCTHHAAGPDRYSTGARNLTVVFQCAETGNLSMLVTGNELINMHDLAKSNCSLHMSNGTIRFRCPRERPQIPRLVREGENLLHRAVQD